MADFVTQPLNPISSAPPAAVQAAQEQGHIAPTSPGVVSSSSASGDESSVLTTSTDGETALRGAAANFGQLRTSDGIQGEAQIEVPSVKKGDWRTWGKVEGRILLWQDGTLRKGKRAGEQPKEEWVVNGTLWVTASKKIVYIFDRTMSPRCVALEKTPASPARRLSLFGGSSSSRKSFSAPSGSPPAGYVSPTADNPAPVATSDAAAANDSAIAEDDQTAAEGKEGGAKGFVGKLKKVFSKSDESEQSTTAAGAEGDHKLSLSRTKTNEKNLKLERTRSTSEPTLGAPFPSYKGHSITALYVGDPSSVLTVRFFGARGTSTPFWSAPSAAPLSSPTELEDRPKPLGGGFQQANDMLPPCVEIDVAPRATGRQGRKTGGGDEGEQREVTIGFNFLETFLSREAEDFRDHLSTFMSTAAAPEPTEGPAINWA